MDQAKIGICLGDETEQLLQSLLEELNDDMLDELQIERELAPSEGLAGEPITAGAVITGGAIVLSAVLRLIERHLEHRQQRRTMQIVAEGFATHPQLGATLAEIAKKNADVSISYGIAREAWRSMKT